MTPLPDHLGTHALQFAQPGQRYETAIGQRLQRGDLLIDQAELFHRRHDLRAPQAEVLLRGEEPLAPGDAVGRFPGRHVAPTLAAMNEGATMSSVITEQAPTAGWRAIRGASLAAADALPSIAERFAPQP